jgi:small subunit ribosomal protein S8
MRSDPIADLLTRIRNASNAEHEKVDIPSSKLKVRIAELLKDEGFIKNFRVLDDAKQNTLRVYLKYGTGNEKMISGWCGCPRRPPVYVTHDKIPSILAGMGVALLSTSRGRVHRPRGAQSRRSAAKSSPTCGRSAHMSRIGKQPIKIPQGVKVAVDGNTVRAEGPKGKLSQPVPAASRRRCTTARW